MEGRAVPGTPFFFLDGVLRFRSGRIILTNLLGLDRCRIRSDSESIIGRDHKEVFGPCLNYRLAKLKT